MAAFLAACGDGNNGKSTNGPAATQANSPAAQTAAGVFGGMLRQWRGPQLDGWLTRAKASGIRELQAYAGGLETDDAAVKAGLH